MTWVNRWLIWMTLTLLLTGIGAGGGEAWAQKAGAPVPDRAYLYLPVLTKEIKAIWPTLGAENSHYLAGQVEQETCPSRTHRFCWSPTAENINPKNNGEYGWGLGMVTNTNRYNNFKEVTTKYSGLKGWKWEDRFNPEYQLRTLVYMDRTCAKPYLTSGVSESVSLQFAFSCYNGGQGAVLKDRAYCGQLEGCDKNVWFGHVETHSLRARTKLSGYSVSAYSINREYVRNIWTLRGPRYSGEMRRLWAPSSEK